MKSIRNYVYAAITILAAAALNLAPTAASAQEPAHGKFTLTHEVLWGNAKLPAGDYEFSFDPDGGSRMLTLNKLSGVRAGYMLLVPDTGDAKASDKSLLVLTATPEGSYVSAMHLPEFGMTLNFPVPAHATEKQIARTATIAAAGQ
jgi:hypothetical protein